VLCSLIECEQIQITAMPTKYLSQLVCLRACWNECPVKQICSAINFVVSGFCLIYPLKGCLCSYIAHDKKPLTHIWRYMKVHSVADIWVSCAVSVQPSAELNYDWITCFYWSWGHVLWITHKGKLIILTTILRKNGSISMFEKFDIVRGVTDK